ncbi:hypothetical protein CMI37_21820 [Candidatus Pacearchaeota archaeon]|jgi:hypothetical protein|nr:hypothetical protein [Candidatus Pacearchaeota archaeon]|tara:strand:- start:4145 stop:4687 length:543 start_codon:yes stop_codon:yes gene_type:complete
MTKNKKGNIMIVLLFFVALFLILFAGFVMIIGSSVVNWVFDEAVPELTNLGTVGGANLTQAADLTIVPLNNIIQSFTWLTGVLFVLMLIGSFGIVFVARAAPSKWLIGFYFMLALILIIGAIFISNMYEEFYDGTDDLASRLKEHTILSYMILYSPAILTIIVFLTGIVLFSGLQQEEFI